MSMKYFIHTVEDASAIKDVPIVEIKTFRHGVPRYEPYTTAAVIYIRDEGFLSHMESFETELRSECTEEDGDTYKDSCMEWFINFAPEKSDCYLNLEANPSGVLHCKYGNNRIRHSLSPWIERPTVKAKILSDRWVLDYFISLHTISQVFGRDSFVPGDILMGNFFKCGDDTTMPHYGMWSPVERDDLDFHSPDSFGKLELV